MSQLQWGLGGLAPMGTGGFGSNGDWGGLGLSAVVHGRELSINL